MNVKQSVKITVLNVSHLLSLSFPGITVWLRWGQEMMDISCYGVISNDSFSVKGITCKYFSILLVFQWCVIISKWSHVIVRRQLLYAALGLFLEKFLNCTNDHVASCCQKGEFSVNSITWHDWLTDWLIVSESCFLYSSAECTTHIYETLTYSTFWHKLCLN